MRRTSSSIQRFMRACRPAHRRSGSRSTVEKPHAIAPAAGQHSVTTGCTTMLSVLAMRDGASKRGRRHAEERHEGGILGAEVHVGQVEEVVAFAHRADQRRAPSQRENKRPLPKRRRPRSTASSNTGLLWHLVHRHHRAATGTAAPPRRRCRAPMKCGTSHITGRPACSGNVASPSTWISRFRRSALACHNKPRSVRLRPSQREVFARDARAAAPGSSRAGTAPGCAAPPRAGCARSTTRSRPGRGPGPPAPAAAASAAATSAPAERARPGASTWAPRRRTLPTAWATGPTPPRSGVCGQAPAYRLQSHRSYNCGVAELMNHLRGDACGPGPWRRADEAPQVPLKRSPLPPQRAGNAGCQCRQA